MSFLRSLPKGKREHLRRRAVEVKRGLPSERGERFEDCFEPFKASPRVVEEHAKTISVCDRDSGS